MARNEDSKETSRTINSGDDSAGAHSGQKRLRRSTRKRAISTSFHAPKEPVTKRSRQISSVAESGSSVGRSDALTKKAMDNLPPEILEAVLQWVTTPDILKCRQVNRKFNEIASRIMRRRADVQLYFSARNDGCFMRKTKCSYCCNQDLLVNVCHGLCKPHWRFSETESLKKLIACLKKAKHFPITSFRFDDLDKFGNEDMKSFLTIWGASILALTIPINDKKETVEVLRDLFIKTTLPNLKKLEIKFDWQKDPSTVELFVDTNEVRLPKLQVFCVDIHCRTYPGIIAPILKAAYNLEHFCVSPNERYAPFDECVRDSIQTNDLDVVQTLNKFHCLKNLQVDLSTELVDYFASNNIDLKLESLALSLKSPIGLSDQLKSSAATILNRWFHSSKDALQTLKIKPLGSLGSYLNIPKFDNLQKLHLFVSVWYGSKVEAIFPPLFDMANHFPNLKELSVTNLENVSFILTTPMPSIEILRVVGTFGTKFEETLLKATPNLTTLIIEEDDITWDKTVSINFELIANSLPKLQSFGWLIRRVTHHDLLHSLDAAITGLPENLCRKLSNKFRNMDSLTAAALAAYQLKPRNPSILDLKELKRFDVTFSLEGDVYADMASGCEGFVEKDDEAGFSPDDILYETGFSKVSQFLAFDLMPNLTVQTHRFVD